MKFRKPTKLILKQIFHVFFFISVFPCFGFSDQLLYFKGENE